MRRTPHTYHMSRGDRRKYHILPTDGMMRHVRESNANYLVVATETGILHRMKGKT